MSDTRQASLREAFGEGLDDLVAEFSQILVLDGDLANSTRADILAARHPEKFLEMGIAEQNLMGVAAAWPLWASSRSSAPSPLLPSSAPPIR